MERRLAAILAADVVGYSRLMGQDEAGTLQALKSLRAEVFDPKIAEHKGRVFKATGDGVLAEFPSVVNAVACAVEIQRALETQNENLSEDRTIQLRIGVNLGDVIVEGEDVFGDGVNVAARLEGIASPGRIAISGTVRDHLGNRLDLHFEDLGEQQLKNIAQPVRVYGLIAGEGNPPARPKPAPEKPSIAVLPFQNMSGDAEQQYFSDGITEDITTELSRFRQLHVLSRSSSSRFRGSDVDMIRAGRELGVQYLVEGSVRRIGARIRITAQLINAKTGNHVWAERYDNSQDEIFDVQDKVVRTIVGTLAGRMKAADVEFAKRKPPANLVAYDYVLRGDALPFGTPAIEAEARLMFEKAIEIDPSYARAYALLSFALNRDWVRDMSGSNELRDQAHEMARTAITLDENDALCQAAMGRAHFNQGDYELAEHHFTKALELNPNQASMQAGVAAFYSRLGQPEKAIACLTEAQRLDPFFTPSWYLVELGIAHFVARRYGEAIASLRQAATLSPTGRAWLVASYANANQPDHAKACAAELMQGTPGFSVAQYLAKGQLVRADDLDHLREGLRKAGLPE